MVGTITLMTHVSFGIVMASSSRAWSCGLGPLGYARARRTIQEIVNLAEMLARVEEFAEPDRMSNGHAKTSAMSESRAAETASRNLPPSSAATTSDRCYA